MREASLQAMAAVLLVALLAVLWGCGMPAQAADRDLSLTIYNDDLALVQERRTIELTGGRQRIEFQDVSAQIRAETAALAAPDLAIVEQNFDYDLLTPAKLMEKAVGQEVTLVRVNTATGAETREKALVLAANGGVVLKLGERIEVLRDHGLPVRVIFDKVPENLRARPTLSVTVDSSTPGSRAVQLSYLTPGLSWKADYVVLFNEADSKLDVQGWVTLTNSSGTTYENAKTLLVAGSPINVVSAEQEKLRRLFGPSQTESPGTERGGRERLGDYYLYPLNERSTVADRQTKQVSFLDVHGVPAEHGTSTAISGWGRKRRRAAPSPSIAFPPAAVPGWAISCRREPCASICAIGAANRSSSARTRSGTPRWARSWRWPPGMPSM